MPIIIHLSITAIIPLTVLLDLWLPSIRQHLFHYPEDVLAVIYPGMVPPLQVKLQPPQHVQHTLLVAQLVVPPERVLDIYVSVIWCGQIARIVSTVLALADVELAGEHSVQIPLTACQEGEGCWVFEQFVLLQELLISFPNRRERVSSIYDLLSVSKRSAVDNGG